MKKIIFALLCVAATSAFAGKESCDSEDVHCSYVTGSVPCSMEEGECKIGKYIRISQSGISMVTCATNWSASTIPQDSIGEYYKEGEKVTTSYSQCFDKTCVSSQHIGDDTFIIQKDAKQQTYTSSPKYYEIKMMADYGQNCEISEMNHKALNAMRIK